MECRGYYRAEEDEESIQVNAASALWVFMCRVLLCKCSTAVSERMSHGKHASVASSGSLGGFS